jgi:hypothetical protein
MVMSKFSFTYENENFFIGVDYVKRAYKFWPCVYLFEKRLLPMDEMTVIDIFGGKTIKEQKEIVNMGYHDSIYQNFHEAVKKIGWGEW